MAIAELVIIQSHNFSNNLSRCLNEYAHGLVQVTCIDELNPLLPNLSKIYYELARFNRMQGAVIFLFTYHLSFSSACRPSFWSIELAFNMISILDQFGWIILPSFHIGFFCLETLHEHDLQIARRVISRFLCCSSDYLFAQINNFQIFPVSQNWNLNLLSKVFCFYRSIQSSIAHRKCEYSVLWYLLFYKN